jgi:hypothetical protein
MQQAAQTGIYKVSSTSRSNHIEARACGQMNEWIGVQSGSRFIVATAMGKATSNDHPCPKVNDGGDLFSISTVNQSNRSETATLFPASKVSCDIQKHPY